MQSLKDYLNKSPLHCEGILNPDQNQVTNRMTDEMIRSRIREYCTYDEQKYYRNELWPAVDEDLEITKIDKDKHGWYIETESSGYIYIMSITPEKSFYDYCIAKGQQIDKQKGFLIEDTGIYFRWRKHEGELYVNCTPNFESTEGLPEELDELDIYNSCEKNKRLDVCNKIKVIILADVADLKISGNKCKNIIINPGSPANVTAPRGVKIYRPETEDKFYRLLGKLKQ